MAWLADMPYNFSPPEQALAMLFPAFLKKDRLSLPGKTAIALSLLCCSLWWGTKDTSAQVYDGITLMRQPMSENLCALTFDDGPSRYTPHILDVLHEHNIPATFFMLGKNALRFPDHVRRIVAEGHETGNHSFSHPNLRRLKSSSKFEELAQTDRILRDLGANPVYMRPPYGAYDNEVVQFTRELGTTIVLWSVDSQDWKRRPHDYGKIINAVGRPFAAGTMRGIILFHDPLKNTANDLPKIIADLRAQGCQRFVTVSEYLESSLNPEPPLLMVKKETPAADTLATPQAVEEPHESAALMPPESYQDSTGGVADKTAPPLARSSRPWREVFPVVTEMPQATATHDLAQDALHTTSQGYAGTAPAAPQTMHSSSLSVPSARHGIQSVSDGIF